jgi:hypothetical protein
VGFSLKSTEAISNLSVILPCLNFFMTLFPDYCLAELEIGHAEGPGRLHLERKDGESG